MSKTTYRIHGFDLEIQDAEIAEEFAEQGHRVTAKIGGGA